MKYKEKLPMIFVLGFFGFGAVLMVAKNYQTVAGKAGMETVSIALSAEGREGEDLFAANCSTCHGKGGTGTDSGPPLVHDIYNPGHHPDESFYAAIANGVPQHHWRYGNMPSQPEVNDGDLAMIIRYIRELQVANGITYKPHRM